jgi:hypothetical protein
MKKALAITIGAVVLAACWGIIVTNAAADTSKSKVTSYVTKMEVLPVPDVPGHLYGIYERRGVAIFENGEEAAYWNCGMFDLINKSGPYQGYCILTYKDGSTIIIKNKGTLMIPKGGKSPVSEGTGIYIKGTGRFEGIKGTLTFKGHYITPYSKDTKGDMIFSTTGTYTLPSK